MKLSIVIPIYNEAENIAPLYTELKSVLSSIEADHEIICINDGSSDGSLAELKKIAYTDPAFGVIDFLFNFGQTAAMSAGIRTATGDIIIPLDGDRQNDPADIPRFLDKIAEGYDVVSGWRQSRRDKLLMRRLPSVIANILIGAITGVKLHDYGCSMKAYRREIIQAFSLYGEMHRFIPAYASWQGGRVAEIVVNHRPRVAGQTKYGIARTFKVLLDLLVVKFLTKYFNRPIHFFGGIGFVSLFIGAIAGILSVALKLLSIRDFVATPLPVFSALFLIIGVQLIVMGVLAEMIMRTYYESQGKVPYAVKEKINLQ